MTADTVTACPECDGLTVVKRVRLEGYLCRRCGWTGAVPAERKKHTDGGPRPGLAGVLEAMDPDDVGGDA